MLTLILSFLIALVVFLLGLITYNSSTDKSAKYFGFLSFLIASWITVNQLGSNSVVSIDARVFLTYIDYSLGVLMAGAFLLFAASVSGSKRALKYGKTLGMTTAVFFATATLLHAVIMVSSSEGNIIIEELVLFFPYIIFVAIMAISGIIILIKGYLSAQSHEKRKLYLIVWGLSVAVASSVICNVLFPLFVSSRNERLIAAYSSYLGVLLFAVFTWIAISKHKLFNLRDAAARSLTYIASVGSIILVYVGVILILSGVDVISGNVSFSQRVIFAFIAVMSGFLFQPFKHFFDRMTNRIFFRDSYDAQVVIDELNKALVNNVELDSLLTKTALILQETLKTSFATFYIRETSYFKPRVIGAHRRQSEYVDLDKLQELSATVGVRVLEADENHKNEDEKQLKKILKSNDIEVLARLVNTLDYRVKGIGYLFLGSKKSGTPYSRQDLKIIEIVANELVIATENVLRYEEIEQFNVTLQKKIDDATKELKQTNEKLKALDEAKDEFVSMASHQLRTPLTSIKGYISMVLEGDAGKVNEDQAKMLGQAFFSSQRMVYLISDLLNVSRLKTGKFIIEAKPVYLPDVVESEINQLYEGASTKNLTLSFTKPKTFATMNLDEMKLRQVIMNFTDNSIYYTPAGGKITVELKETPKSVEFTVKDSGIGVPKEQQQKLFTKFYRADNARKARPDGTGLGLFMAKKVIIAQGGAIIFDSKEGKGSTFGFSFPKDRLEVKTEPEPK